MIRYVRRRWEDSRGDAFDAWGPSWWYFEVDQDGRVSRHVEEYDCGPRLRFDTDHAEGRRGFLPRAALPPEEVGPWEVSKATFEAAWDAAEYDAAHRD